jgi:hypothetical protein
MNPIRFWGVLVADGKGETVAVQIQNPMIVKEKPIARPSVNAIPQGKSKYKDAI